MFNQKTYIMKNVKKINLQKFIEQLAYLKFQRIFGVILFFLSIIGSGFAQNQKNAWLNGEVPDNFSFDKIGNTNLTIEYENFPLYSNNENKIKITSSDKNAIIKVILPKEKPIEFKGSHIFTYKPLSYSIDKFPIISGKDTIYSWFSVSSIPNPTLFFDSTNYNILLKDEIFTTKLHARIKNKICKVLQYKLVIVKNEAKGYSYSSSGTTVTNQDSIFTKQNRNAITYLDDGDDFYLTEVLVEMPDGSKRYIDYKKFKLVKNKFQRNYCRDLKFEKSPLITKLYCDLRIKIETDSLKSKTKIFESFFEELNKEMHGTKVKFVGLLPNITFSKNDFIYKTIENQNFFYPDVKNKIKITQKSNWNFKLNRYEKIDVSADEFIEIILKQIGIEYNKSTVIKDSSGYYHLTPLSKEHLNNLYSSGSINRIYKELKFNDPRETGTNYILIIVIFSTLIFLVIKEFIISTNFGKKFFIYNHALWKLLITYSLVVQIPLAVFLLIESFIGTKITISYFFTAETYYLIYTILVGTMLWGLDKIQKAIKSFPLRLLLDFVLTMVIFWAAYQLLFMATHLDYVRVDMLRWQWIYIPLMVAIYRIYSLYNQRKIDQLLQEKELEISKQKELTTKAELLALQSRINPHFLYNALNSIASLTSIDAHKAEQMSVDLAKLFRYNLNKAEDLMTTIESELEMVKLYLDIEKQRFGDRLDYQVDVPNELMSFQIPIFLLQPLVENAIKHGVSKITEQGVLKIKIEKNDHQLFIRVFDNGPLFTDELIFGYGLQNIFDKLTLVYKDNYTIRFVNESEKHIEIGIFGNRKKELRIQN